MHSYDIATWKTQIQQKFQVPTIVGPPFPYYSHTIPIRIPWSMGMGGLWEGGPTIEAPWKNPKIQKPSFWFCPAGEKGVIFNERESSYRWLTVGLCEGNEPTKHLNKSQH